ncbi:MAG TPA: hypothetical protein VIU44_12160, partial [Gaiellaceae bacterium]
MQNPFRSEAEAFHLLVVTVVAFGLIALASIAGGTWWGVGVFVVLSAAAALYYLRGPMTQPPAITAPARHSPPGERRILVVANETVGGAA